MLGRAEEDMKEVVELPALKNFVNDKTEQAPAG